MINKGNLKNAISALSEDHNNAVSHVFKDAELKNEGSLANTVFTLKDNYADTNVIARGSSLILNNFKPEYKATALRLLEEAGATCVARTNLDEFGLGGSGEYSAFGLIKNPLNSDYLVGGSSSGAAATFNKNIAFAMGSDTGDSVRKPASNIGVVGFKPSYGAISRYGLFAFASSLDTVAFFTHNVQDTIEVSQVLFKQDLKHDLTSVDLSFDKVDVKIAKPQKVAYLDCFDKLDESVKEAYQQFLEKLTNDGIELIKIQIEEKLLNSIDVVYKVIAFSEASSNLANLVGTEFGERIEGNSWEDTYSLTRSKGLGKMVQSRLILGSYFLKQENQIKYFVKAKKMRRYLSEYFTNIHRSADIFIYPASNMSAPKFNETYPKSYMDFILTNANLTGNPSLTLKLGKDKNNMPFNLAIDGELYHDTKMLSHALYVEKMLGEDNE
ncbi:amidase family protein [Metamycoplasma neophronis]|uniref:Asp-tRNA(Asn)/Glu-tRNA(Gln) amidotransferase subunit GatA n=1 Tax=Metamycoplasma neophronis TaxID=872983 RepID=A0ABY2Z0A1_9BACT|nr:amidase family protein [Metamycoplasma neophronis]TPR54311.1 Asp-tRNA(Asn)/Glu-tRNA(Gln) amidotransferase subunit GatA [Metamycoplasma neophronis]